MPRQLGYVSLIVATGGPTNPVGIAVTIAAGAAMVLSRFLQVGAGRTEADYLTNPETGAQHHAGLAMDGVTAEFWNHPESWTSEHIDAVVSALQKIGTDFESYAGQFSRAGPGAIATIWYWINRAIADIRGVTPLRNDSISTTPPLHTQPLSPAPLYLNTLAPFSSPSYGWLIVFGLGVLALRRKR